MSTETTEARIDDARQKLRRRQGAGARWDAASAPHADLMLARRGVAYFARNLNGLAKAELSAPTPWLGRSRREVAARVAYYSRDLAAQAAAVRTGSVPVAKAGQDEQEKAVALAVTLPDEALRYLVDHAAIQLNCEWRDLEDVHWTAAADDVSAVMRRPQLWAWANWLAAVAISPHARLDDLPADILKTNSATGPDPMRGTLLAGLTINAVRGDQRMKS
jgi:maleylpyruvate isomerase